MFWKKYGRKSRIRQQTLQLVSLLCRWCQVREDLLFAFDKSLASGLEQPMKQVVQDFLTRIRGGMDMEQALDLLQHSLDHEHFQDLVLAIRFNFRHRGNLPVLLEHLELQLNQIEEEYTRRRLSNARDRNLARLILGAVPVIFMIRFFGRTAVQEAFGKSPAGAGLLVFGLAAYGAAIAALLLIQRQIAR